jgi:Zn-finger nucleic acid-binding protein
MNCPTCRDTILVMGERQGIEIDYCPKCRGVWLDKGKLDRIIEPSAPERQTAPAPTREVYPEKHHDRHYDEHNRHIDNHHKKKGIFDLFD